MPEYQLGSKRLSAQCGTYCSPLAAWLSPTQDKTCVSKHRHCTTRLAARGSL